MFYEVSAPLVRDAVSAIVVLTPSESKRLLGKAVAALPEVKKAMQSGTIVIGKGTTNAYIVEELLGSKIERAEYSAGVITAGGLKVNAGGSPRPFVLLRGKLADLSLADALKDFGKDDVFIKGANAVDSQGNAGILVSSNVAGTIGSAFPVVGARGSHLILPVGLEKLAPSVIDSAGKCGVFRFKYAMGESTALIPVVTGRVVTEVQALAVLGNVRATHVASGGVGGYEGAVTLVLEGSDQDVKRAYDLLVSLKGEPALARPERIKE